MASFVVQIISNERRTFGLSHYVAVSVIEVSDVDVDFTEAVLMLILYQQCSTIDCLLVWVIKGPFTRARVGYQPGAAQSLR